jgi:hypothetical protein
MGGVRSFAITEKLDPGTVHHQVEGAVHPTIGNLDLESSTDVAKKGGQHEPSLALDAKYQYCRVKLFGP